MKKNDESQKGRNEEELFDLSLDDLEPEDTILEPHVEDSDVEIIELMDLVEKGDIDLGQEDRGSKEPVGTIQELAEDSGIEIKIDQTLDLFNVPLDQFEEPIDEDKDLASIDLGIEESDLLAIDEIDEQAEETREEDIFDELADESALKELIADEVDTVMDKASPEEPIRPEASTVEEEKIEEKPDVKQFTAPAIEEAPRTTPPEAVLTGISEEKIEAIIRKVVEEVVERVARETMTSVAEKVIGDAINTLKKSIESAAD